MADGPVILSGTNARRLLSGARRGGGLGIPATAAHTNAQVRVKGPGVPMTTTTTTGTTTTGTGTTTPTSTTTTATTTSPPGSTSLTTTATTTTTPPAVTVYLGAFVYRDPAKNNPEESWYEDGDCWVMEDNNLTLVVGCVYSGDVVADYNGLSLVSVQAGNEISCTSTTTSTTERCAGHCVWELDEANVWVRVSSTCDLGCDCPPPDFCPDDLEAEGCANTRTLCARDYSPPEELPECTTTGTGTTSETSATTAGTTTTPDPAVCGPGCLWKHVVGFGTMLIDGGCLEGVVASTGPDGTVFLCGGCAYPGDLTPCETAYTPCLMSGFPPPRGCGGHCRWVWPGEPGLWWIFVEGGCSTEVVGQDCRCDPPSAAGNDCGDQTDTPCTVRRTTGTGTTGTGTTATTQTSITSRTTTTTGCGGTCQYRWDTGAGVWVRIADCGEDCGGCADPLYDGDDDCSVTETPCFDTTTTSTTGTGTTTTCADACAWLCTRTGWVKVKSCPSAECSCRPPLTPCSYPFNGGAVIETACGHISTTTSATSTTGGCHGLQCAWNCRNGTWILLYSDCTQDCHCPAPTEQCTPALSGRTVAFPCGRTPPPPPDTTSTSTTATVTSESEFPTSTPAGP
jgi:hypothetical protein